MSEIRRHPIEPVARIAAAEAVAEIRELDHRSPPRRVDLIETLFSTPVWLCRDVCVCGGEDCHG